MDYFFHIHVHYWLFLNMNKKIIRENIKRQLVEYWRTTAQTNNDLKEITRGTLIIDGYKIGSTFYYDQDKIVAESISTKECVLLYDIGCELTQTEFRRRLRNVLGGAGSYCYSTASNSLPQPQMRYYGGASMDNHQPAALSQRAEIESLKAQLASQQAEIESLKAQLASQQAEINLLNQINTLNFRDLRVNTAVRESNPHSG